MLKPRLPPGRARAVSQGRRRGEGKVRDPEAGEGKRAGKCVWESGGERKKGLHLNILIIFE